MPCLSSLLLLLPLLACGDKDPAEEAPDIDQDGFDVDLDCDDLDPAVNPGAQEVCDGQDNDCDTLVDDADDDVDLSGAGVYHADVDFDGYGDPDAPRTACALPAGYVADDTDCDDGDEGRHPGAEEVCDEVDNDCDLDVDEGVSAVDFYTDADGDGYGDDATLDSACTAPEGSVEVAGDCDDDDGTISPDGQELCNGVDDDCDDQVDGDGLVALENPDGSWTDLSAMFLGGPGAPADMTIGTPGTVWFCDGSYSVNIDLEAEVELRGRSGDASAVVLDGEQGGSVIEVTAAGVEVGLYDLTLTDGRGDSGSVVFGAEGAGGGLACEVDASVTAAGLVVQDNQADNAGGLYLAGCDLSLSDSVVEGNTAQSAAGGFLSEGTHLLSGVKFTDNVASFGIGGLFLYHNSDGNLVELNDVIIEGNQDMYQVGGLYAQWTDLTMAGSTPGAAALTNNTSRFGVGAVHLYPVTTSEAVRFDQVDFGTEAGGDDNTLPELYHAIREREYVAGDSRSFSCDFDSCGTSTSVTLGSTDNSVTMSSRFYGNVVEADEYASVDSLSVYLGYSTGCTADLYVLSTASDPMGSTATWTVEWLSTSHSVVESGFVSATDVNVLTQPGHWYAYGMGVRCSSGYDLMYYESASGTDVGHGEHVGYVSYSGSYTSAFGSTASLTGVESAVQFHMTVGATEL